MWHVHNYRIGSGEGNYGASSPKAYNAYKNKLINTLVWWANSIQYVSLYSDKYTILFHDNKTIIVNK